MPLPDDPDDNAGSIPPLPKDDRLWRHPSEMTASQPLHPPTQRRRPSRSGLLAFLLIGFVAASLGVAASGFTGSTSKTPNQTGLTLGPAATAIAEADLVQLTSTLVRVTIDGPYGSSVITGLMLRSDGHVITSADPLKGARSITVTTADNRAFNAVVIGTDPADDLAVIDIEATGLPTPKLGTTTLLNEGDTVYVVSRSAGDSRAWIGAAKFQSRGLRLDAIDGTSLHDMTRSTLETAPPSSSAVLCSQTGEIIGLLTSRTPIATDLGEHWPAPSTLVLQRAHVTYAHPVSWMSHVADNIIESGLVHNASLGIMASDAVEGGAFIQSVAPNGPAGNAGLKGGDRITSLAGQPVRNSSELIVVLRHFHANDLVMVEWVRGENALKMTAKLSDRT